jgi:hypothetical protein
MCQTSMYLTTFKKTLLEVKAQLDLNTVTVGDFNIPLSAIARTSRQKNQQKYHN